MRYLEQKLAQSKYIYVCYSYSDNLLENIVILSFWKKFPFNVFNFWLIFTQRHMENASKVSGTNLGRISYMDI